MKQSFTMSRPRIFWKTIGYVAAGLFIFLNLILAIQAYHFTHFYENGTVDPSGSQTASFSGQLRTAFLGVKLEKLKGVRPDSPFAPVKLKTKEGLTLDGWYISVPHPKGTIALFHGHGSEKSANLSQSNAFNEMGYSTILIDFRAHGQSEGNTCTIGYREAEDVKLVFDYLKSKGDQHIILYGISLGAATITRAVAFYQLNPDKIILEMPFGSLPRTVEGKMRMAGLPGEPLGGLLTFWGSVLNGFWAFNMKPEEFVKKINCPVLLQWGRKDRGVTESEIQRVYRNIPGTKTLVVYENSGHQNLCENEPEKWEQSIGAFLGVQPSGN